MVYVLLFWGGIWGRFPWWGVSWPLRTTVCWGVSPRRQGGPWAPPPCSSQILKVFVFFALLLCSVVGFVSGIVSNFVFVLCCLLGWNYVLLFNPSRCNPYEFYYCVFFCWVVRRRRLFFCLYQFLFCLSLSLNFFLILSQALGKNNPFSGLHFPKCFFILAMFINYSPYTIFLNFPNVTSSSSFSSSTLVLGCSWFRGW